MHEQKNQQKTIQRRRGAFTSWDWGAMVCPRHVGQRVK